MKKPALLLFTMVATAFLTACSSNSSDDEIYDDGGNGSFPEKILIGKWYCLPRTNDGVYLVYNNDGTYKFASNTRDKIEGGEWKIEGNQLYMRCTYETGTEVSNRSWHHEKIKMDKTLLITECMGELYPYYYVYTRDGYLESHYNSMIIGKWDNGRSTIEFKKDGTYTSKNETGVYVIFNDVLYIYNNRHNDFDGRSILKLDNTTLNWVNRDKVETYTKVS